MWSRNLFFVAVVVGGIFALRASLFPLSTEARKVKFDPGLAKADEFQAVARQVDEAFQKEWHDKGLSHGEASGMTSP